LHFEGSMKMAIKTPYKSAISIQRSAVSNLSDRVSRGCMLMADS
jgi:hypothetical protein